MDGKGKDDHKRVGWMEKERMTIRELDGWKRKDDHKRVGWMEKERMTIRELKFRHWATHQFYNSENRCSFRAILNVILFE